MLPANETAAFVYTIVSGQFITAGANNLPVDLNILAILEVMDLYDISNKPETLKKVLIAGRQKIDYLNKKAESMRKAQKRLR